MGKPLLVVSSVTYAMKAKDLLFRQGIRSYVERIPKTESNGCGYGVYVPQDSDRAARILQENNIRILERLSQDQDDGR